MRNIFLQEAPHEHLVAPVESPYTHSLLKDRAQYEEMYRESIESPAKFWGKIAEQFHWETKVDLKTVSVSWPLLVHIIL